MTIPARVLRWLPLGPAALLFGLCAAHPVGAQDRETGPPARAVIAVAPADNACTYRIRNQQNQDRFSLRPAGVLRVQVRGGLWVDVTVEDDAAAGIPGTRAGRTLVLRGANGGRAVRDSLVARSAVGETTEHQVHVQCCLEESRGQGQGQECRRWADARPPEMTTGVLRPGALPRPHRPAEARGPAAPPLRTASTPLKPLPPGGPVMEVQE
jgi:hypothetical protein